MEKWRHKILRLDLRFSISQRLGATSKNLNDGEVLTLRLSFSRCDACRPLIWTYVLRYLSVLARLRRTKMTGLCFMELSRTPWDPQYAAKGFHKSPVAPPRGLQQAAIRPPDPGNNPPDLQHNIFRISSYLKVKRTAKLGFWKLAVAPLPFMIYFRAMLILVPRTVPRIPPPR